MQDIATLSIDVDSTAVRKSKEDLASLDAQSSATESSVFSLEKAFIALAAAAAAVKVVEMVKEATMLAARYETLGVVMEVMGNNAGLTSGQMNTLQIELEKTGISSIKARESLNMLAAAHVDMANASKLARIAQDAAVIAGVNSSEAFNTLVKSVQTGIVVTAHHMGVMVSYEGAYKRMKEAIGAHGRELTESEKTQARMNEMLEQGALRAGVYDAAMGTAGKQLKSMERYIENLQVQVGSLFGPVFTSAVSGASEGLKNASEGMKGFIESGDASIVATKIKSSFQDAIRTVVDMTKFLYEHRGAILAIGAAWVSISVGTKVFEMVNQITAWIAVQRASAVANIQARLAKEADIAVAQRQAMSLTTLTAAEEGLIRAEVEAAVAIRAKTMAANSGTVALETMTVAGNAAKTTFMSFAGIFSVIVSVVTMAATAMFLFKESATKSADDAIKSAEEYNSTLDDQLEAQKRFWDLKSKGSSTDDAIKSTVEAVDKTPQIRALDKAYGDLQVKLNAYGNDRQAIADKMQTADEGNAAVIANELKSYDDIASRMKSILSLRERIVEKANQARSGSEAIQAERIASGKRPDEVSDAKEKESVYASELLRIELELAKARTENTMLAKATAESDALDVQHKQNILRWQKEANKEKPGLTEGEVRDLTERDAKLKVDKQKQIMDQLAEEQVRVDASTQSKLRNSDRETWSAKIEIWKQAFHRLNEERKKASLDTFGVNDFDKFMQNNTIREMPNEIQRLNSELKKLEEEKGRALTFKEEIAALDELGARIDASTEATKKLKAQLQKKDERQGDFFGGMKEGFISVGQSMDDLFTEGKKMATDFSNKTADAFAKMASSGKFEFKGLLKYIMEEIIRFLMAKAVTMFITSFMGASSNSGSSGYGTTGNFYAQQAGDFSGGKATGGSTVAGNSYLIGEQGPEIWTAPAAGTVIPNDQLFGGGNQNNTTIVIKIDKSGNKQTEADNDDNFTRALAADVVRVVDQRIEEHKRSGGKLNPISGRS